MESETLKQNIEKFIQSKTRNWKAKTLKNNKYYFGLLLSTLRGTEFNRDTAENFFNLLSNKKATSTRHQAETCILAFVRWLSEEGIIETNWGRRIERTRIVKSPRILPSQSEVLKLIKIATESTQKDNRLTRFSKMEHRACLCFIVVACGGRNFETNNILRSDVSMSGRQLTISHGKTGPRNATIPNVPWLIKDLERRVKGVRDDSELKTLSDRTHYKETDMDRLFVVNEKKLEEHMRKVGELFGRPMNVHDLRRIFARDLKGNGAPIDEIKDVMGHKSIETTMGYLEYDTSTQARTLKNYSSEARKYHTKEEKAKEFEDVARKIGNILEYNFDGSCLTMKLKVV